MTAAITTAMPSIGKRNRLSLEQAREALDMCNSYERMPTLIGLYFQMAVGDWHVVLGEEWSCCDNIGRHRHLLRMMLPARGPVVGMMTDDELMAYHALPDRLTVYRGCGPKNMFGPSWTTDEEVGRKFPKMLRYWQKEPLLVTATVRKHSVLAVKLDRGEAEIITFSTRRTHIERLVPTHPFTAEPLGAADAVDLSLMPEVSL